MLLGVNGTVGGGANPTRATIAQRTPAKQPPIATMPPPCDVSRIIGGDPGVQFVPLVAPAGNAVGDVPLLLPIAAKFIMVVACDVAHLADSLYFHFQQLNKVYSGLAIVPNGTEQWFPLQASNAISKVGNFWLFDRPMPRTIYFDIGHEAGGGVQFNMTLLIAEEEVKTLHAGF